MASNFISGGQDVSETADGDQLNEPMDETVQVQSNLNPEPNKHRSARTNLEPHLPVLLEFYNRGMQGGKNPVTVPLIKEAARQTGLSEKVVERWMRNRDNNLKRPPTRKINPNPKRKSSALDLFKRDYLKGKPGKLRTAEAVEAFKRLEKEDPNRFNEYHARAKDQAGTTTKPEDCSPTEREQAIQKLYKQLLPTLNKLQDWDCDVALLSYDHTTNNVFKTGTDAGQRFIENNPQVEWGFHTSLVNERATTATTSNHKPVSLKDQVSHLLNDKWLSFSGRHDGFPYQDVKDKKYLVEGLPEGFVLGKPGEIGKGKLETILRHKDVIVIKENLTVQASSSTSTVQGQGTNQDDVPMPAITAPNPNSSATECMRILNGIDKSVVEPDDQTYEIEYLVCKKKDEKNRVYYEVKWLDYPAEKNTFESHQHLLKSLGGSTLRKLIKNMA